MTWGCYQAVTGIHVGMPFLRHVEGVSLWEPSRRQLLSQRPLNCAQPTRAEHATTVGESVLSLQRSASGLEQALSAADETRTGTHATPIHPSGGGGSSSSRWEDSSHGSSLPASQEESQLSSGVREEDLLELGSFGAPHGVRGDIRLFPTTDSAKDRLAQPGTRWTLPREMGTRRRRHVPKQVEIVCGRPILQKGKEVWLLRVKGFDSPEAADMLKGLRLLMPASERPELESDEEFYVQELIGMQVIMQASGEAVGSVVDVYDGTGTHDVLRIALKSGGADSAEAESGQKTTLLPFATEIVPVVDRASRRMEITPPEGLLDIVTTVKTSAALPRKL